MYILNDFSQPRVLRLERARASSSSLLECYLRHSCAMSHVKCTLGACAPGSLIYVCMCEVLAPPLMLKNFQHTAGVMLSDRWLRCNATCEYMYMQTTHTWSKFRISFPKFCMKFWNFPKCINLMQSLVAKCDAHVRWSSIHKVYALI